MLIFQLGGEKMKGKSHIDEDKLARVPEGHPFEYRDIVDDSLPVDEHTADGRRFKEEVVSGVYDNVKIEKDTDNRILYRKL
jgi:hypothetical protein